jgi:hypothetical protein
MRRDTAPADAPFGVPELVRNFEMIALHDEYVEVGGRFIRRTTPSTLRRWERPVRVARRHRPLGAPRPGLRRPRPRRRLHRPPRAAHRPRHARERRGRRQLPRPLPRPARSRRPSPTRPPTRLPGFEPSVIAPIRTTPVDIFCTAYAFAEPGEPRQLRRRPRAHQGRAPRAHPPLLHARGDGPGDGPAQRLRRRPTLALQRQPRIRLPHPARRGPAPHALRPAPA